jgi:hypothetical protein
MTVLNRAKEIAQCAANIDCAGEKKEFHTVDRHHNGRAETIIIMMPPCQNTSFNVKHDGSGRHAGKGPGASVDV